MRSLLVVLFSVLVGSVASAQGLPTLPNHLQCLDNHHQAISYNNSQVIQWEKTTQDQYHDRGLVQGPITKIYANQSGHNHFAISLGNGQAIEVIYSEDFGALPALQVGQNIIACGDYITVGPHARLPSPQPAIIHWVHYNPGTRDGGAHPGGFVIINNVAYGQTGQ